MEDEISSEIEKYFETLSLPFALYQYYSRDLKEKDIFIEKIANNSPIELILSGSGGLLLLALIFSGGGLSILGGLIKININSLEEGIRKFRRAIRPRGRRH